MEAMSAIFDQMNSPRYLCNRKKFTMAHFVFYYYGPQIWDFLYMNGKFDRNQIF